MTPLAEKRQQANELIAKLNMNYRHGTDVWRTWYERGSAQWRRYVDSKPKEKPCSVPNVDGPHAC